MLDMDEGLVWRQREMPNNWERDRAIVFTGVLSSGELNGCLYFGVCVVAELL
jgi:hypothetical protein